MFSKFERKYQFCNKRTFCGKYSKKSCLHVWIRISQPRLASHTNLTYQGYFSQKLPCQGWRWTLAKWQKPFSRCWVCTCTHSLIHRTHHTTETRAGLPCTRRRWRPWCWLLSIFRAPHQLPHGSSRNSPWSPPLQLCPVASIQEPLSPENFQGKWCHRVEMVPLLQCK